MVGWNVDLGFSGKIFSGVRLIWIKFFVLDHDRDGNFLSKSDEKIFIRIIFRSELQLQ